MKKSLVSLTIAALMIIGVGATNAQDGTELINKALNAYYYPGADGKAEIKMEIIAAGGGVRNREMVMVRLNTGEPGGNQKFFIYFKQPNDVRDTTFMVYKNEGKNDDRWIFVPSVKLINKIAASDKRGSFMGSDFNYEDVSGRFTDQDSHTFEKEEDLDGRATYVVKSTPNDKTEYTYKRTWIDKENFLPVKEEYYGTGDELLRTFTLGDIQDIDGFATPMKRTMKDHKTGGHSVITIEKAQYNLKLKESDFSERRMRRPPRGWIR